MSGQRSLMRSSTASISRSRISSTRSFASGETRVQEKSDGFTYTSTAIVCLIVPLKMGRMRLNASGKLCSTAWLIRMRLSPRLLLLCSISLSTFALKFYKSVTSFIATDLLSKNERFILMSSAISKLVMYSPSLMPKRLYSGERVREPTTRVP